ncbi:DUF1566 domain-containing protein [Aquitalea magnusonii]|uniref:Uncharacterized protein DUF1566 n=1 Tax=Aquitalea magnusonii TaxID=332411 RepID=A0A318JJJ0_9NEIS|nr:DUF1566 domain-containing protein [Aquitalea magnusonii]PXX49408.1 uncharacterized protein DUF1566 [Aquitalea magnusonii]
MEQSTISIPVGSATLLVQAEDAARIIIDSIMKPQAPAIFTSKTVPDIGQHWDEQGGIYAGKARGISIPDYHLVIASGDGGFVEDIQWGGYEEDEPEAKCQWDGLANTHSLVKSKHSHPAAEWAAGLVICGFADWYLPSRRESALCYAMAPEAFPQAGWHWTSTQYSPGVAWVQGFNGGTQGGYHKGVELRARAVRRISSI